MGQDPIPTDARLAFFNETRHSYGRTALLLSGGAALGIYHVGVVKTLMENRLMPRVLGGASAGSIIICEIVGNLSGHFQNGTKPLHDGIIFCQFLGSDGERGGQHQRHGDWQNCRQNQL
jgi:hypothetical protein